MHDIEWASHSSDALRYRFDGLDLTVRPKPSRLQQLREAVTHACSGVSVSGQQLEAIVGHYIFMGLFVGKHCQYLALSTHTSPIAMVYTVCCGLGPSRTYGIVWCPAVVALFHFR